MKWQKNNRKFHTKAFLIIENGRKLSATSVNFLSLERSIYHNWQMFSSVTNVAWFYFGYEWNPNIFIAHQNFVAPAVKVQWNYCIWILLEQFSVSTVVWMRMGRCECNEYIWTGEILSRRDILISFLCIT